MWTDPKEGHTESHPPSINQTAVADIEAGCWQSNESDRERMMVDCQSWMIETTRTEHSPPAATVLVAAPFDWSSVVVLVQNLQNLHDCFVPLHCHCCIIIALRMFHINLSFGVEANYNDWYVNDFIQSVHITHSFKCLNLPVHKVTNIHCWSLLFNIKAVRYLTSECYIDYCFIQQSTVWTYFGVKL